MSDENQNAAQEREQLFEQARKLGLNVSGNISTPNLRMRITEHLVESSQAEAKTVEVTVPKVRTAKSQLEEVDLSGITDPAKYRAALIDSEMRMVRCTINNLDPKKADLHGEIFCVSNDFIGDVKRFIPYGDETADGWHVPLCIFRLLQARQFQHIRSFRDKNTNLIKVETTLRPEFALEVLPPLTEQELADLRAANAGQ